MNSTTLTALRIELDQLVKDFEYLLTEGVSAALDKEDMKIMMARAATLRSLAAQLEKKPPLRKTLS